MLASEGYEVFMLGDPAPDATLVSRSFSQDQLSIIAAPTLALPSCACGQGGAPVAAVVRMAVPDTAVRHVASELERAIAISQVLQPRSLCDTSGMVDVRFRVVVAGPCTAEMGALPNGWFRAQW